MSLNDLMYHSNQWWIKILRCPQAQLHRAHLVGFNGLKSVMREKYFISSKEKEK
jgi:hypothetical protein